MEKDGNGEDVSPPTPRVANAERLTDWRTEPIYDDPKANDRVTREALLGLDGFTSNLALGMKRLNGRVDRLEEVSGEIAGELGATRKTVNDIAASMGITPSIPPPRFREELKSFNTEIELAKKMSAEAKQTAETAKHLSTETLSLGGKAISAVTYAGKAAFALAAAVSLAVTVAQALLPFIKNWLGG